MIIQNENDIKQTLYNSHKFKYYLEPSFSVSPFICLASLLAAGSCFHNNIGKAFCQKKNMNNMYQIINFLSMWTNEKCFQ